MDKWFYCGEEYCIGIAGGDIIELRSEDSSKSIGFIAEKSMSAESLKVVQ